MSIVLKHQIIDKTCEGCGKTTTYDLLDPANIPALQQWCKHIREIWFEGQWIKLVVDSCGEACVGYAVAKTLIPPQPDEPADEIDLASLRTNTEIN